MRMSDGLLQYLIFFDGTLVADLQPFDDPAHFCNPSRVITVERLNVDQTLASLTVRRTNSEIHVMNYLPVRDL